MEKIPTAAEKLMDLKSYFCAETDGTEGTYAKWDEVIKIMEEYSIIKAKFYVEAALNAAAETSCSPSEQTAILRAYSFENIK